MFFWLFSTIKMKIQQKKRPSNFVTVELPANQKKSSSSERPCKSAKIIYIFPPQRHPPYIFQKMCNSLSLQLTLVSCKACIGSNWPECQIKKRADITNRVVNHKEGIGRIKAKAGESLICINFQFLSKGILKGLQKKFFKSIFNIKLLPQAKPYNRSNLSLSNKKFKTQVSNHTLSHRSQYW